MSNQIMCDLETLDTAPTAQVLSIGAVRFDPNTGEIGEKFHKIIDLQSQHDNGRTTSESTKSWWAQQSEEARSIFTAPKEKTVIALADFYDFVGKDCIGFWGNGAAFDNVILTDLYASFALRRPWGYTVDRCYRTVKALFDARFDSRTQLPKFEGTKHDALADAEHQAKCLMIMSERLGLVL